MAIADRELLEASLVVMFARPASRLIDTLLELGQHELSHRFHPTIEIDGPDHGFHRVGEDRWLLPTARDILSLAEPQAFAQTERDADLCKGAGAHHHGTSLCELTFRKTRKRLEDVMSDNSAEYGIA